MARRALFSDRSWIEWNEDIVQDIGYVIMVPVMDTSNAVGVLRTPYTVGTQESLNISAITPFVTRILKGLSCQVLHKSILFLVQFQRIQAYTS